MTTIAWDGKGTLASDSQGTVGGMATFGVKKVFQADGSLYLLGGKVELMAVSGTDGDIKHLSKFISESDEFACGEMHEELEMSAFIFTENNECFVLVKGKGEKMPSLWLQHGHYAIGSGMNFAMSAMKMGLGAVDAVMHACDMCIYTGGDVVKYDV